VEAGTNRRSSGLDTRLLGVGHDLRAFCIYARRESLHSIRGPPNAYSARINDSGAVEEARSELVGKAVVLTDGKAGTVDNVWLDELHGLRISITGHVGK
jgi:hypothetical protein